MNTWFVDGRLTSDAVTRFTEAGNAVVRLRVAVKRRAPRENEPEADFITFTAFGKVAERLDKCRVTKGTKLIIQAEIQNDDYTDRDGNKKRDFLFRVRDFEFAESKGSRVADSQEAPAGSQFTELDEDEDDGGDLPF